MASSSSSKKSCFHCKDSSTDSLRNGWDLSTGKYAQLCNRCYSIYEGGKFCKTFHLNQDDWRLCEFCDKPLHCGCLVSFNNWVMLGAEEALCMECSKITSFMEQNFSNVEDCADVIETLRVCDMPKCTIAYMFDKLLTAGDTSNKDGGIVIPKEHAEAYFAVSDPQGIPVSVIDTKDFKTWDLRLRFWLNKMYIIDDLREIMVSNKLQAGDTLTFSRVIPDGPYVMGFKKASTKKPSVP